jgi:uncharacterized protein (TIGR02246 family)
MPENEAPHTADDEEIRRLWVQACDAWTRGDAHAYGETFTPDVDYVPYDGSLVRGRQAVVDSHDRLFRGVLAGSSLVGEVESIRYIDADVAIVHTMGSVLMPWRSKLPKRRLSRQTVIAVRTGEGWRGVPQHPGPPGADPRARFLPVTSLPRDDPPRPACRRRPAPRRHPVRTADELIPDRSSGASSGTVG